MFACLALPAVALIARELIGDRGAAGVVLLTAVAPIPVLYTTFGRPHTLLFAWLQWGTVLALKAGRDRSRGWWVAAGAVLGLSVFVHPTAPLYALTAFAAAAVYVPRAPRVVLREAWPGAVVLVVAFVPYYLRTLHVLNDRYAVGSGKPGSRTFTGRPVWEDALHFVAPGRHDLNYFTVLALLGVGTVLVARRSRVLAFCALTIAAPVLFFSVVPANGDSALFFDRYMIPATPAFMVLVVAGCLGAASWSGRWSLLVLAILVAGLVGIELRFDANRRDGQRDIRLDAITQAVRHEPRGTVLFGSTGTSGVPFSSFDYGHPANLLDRYISLRVSSLEYVDDDSCERAVAFVRSSAPKRGLWLFYAAAPADRGAARAAFARLQSATAEEVPGGYFVVRSRRALPPRALISLGRSVRLRWRAAVPMNRRVNELLQADRQLLRSPVVCTPYGDLGDPAISPHWPPVTTSHQ